MIKSIWKRIWKTKLEIAEINRDVEFKKMAHEAALSIAAAHQDFEVIGYPRRKYKEVYDLEYDRVLSNLLGWIHTEGIAETHAFPVQDKEDEIKMVLAKEIDKVNKRLNATNNAGLKV